MEKFAEFDPNHQRKNLEFTIERARDEHAHSITKLELRVVPEAKFETVLKIVKNILQREAIFLAFVGEEVVGYGKVKFVKENPEGYFLMGLGVDPDYRGNGVGDALTRTRLEYIKGKADKAYYFVNSTNLVSITLHESFGFKKVDENFNYPGVTFSNGGVGWLYAKDLQS